LLEFIFAMIDTRKHLANGFSYQDNQDIILDNIRYSQLPVTAQLAKVQLNLSDIYNLQVGDIIDLNKLENSSVNLYVGRQPWFTGRMGVSKKNLAVQIEGLVGQPAKEEEEEERLQLYRKAVYTYTGEFLSAYAGVMWVGSEARRYSAMFCECAECAAAILRENQDWTRLEKLGRYASATVPFSDWESLIMEALVESGRYEEAKWLYAETVDNYLREQGIYPSAQMMQAMERLGNQMLHSYELLDTIQKKLKEESEDTPDGGYYC